MRDSKDSTKLNEEINKKRREILTKNYDVIINNENEIITKDYESLQIKGLIMGDSLVGKTSLVYWLLHNKFIDQYQISHSFNIEKISFIIEQTNIELTIIDVPGNGEFDDITNKSIESSNIFILVYSIDKKNTFDNLNNLLSNINKFKNEQKKIFYCLLGNKLDNEDRREVTKIEAEQFRDEKNFDFFQEVSAKNGTNINEMFKKLIEKIYKHNKVLKIGNEEKLSSETNFEIKILPEELNIKEEDKKKCCKCCCC